MHNLLTDSFVVQKNAASSSYDVEMGLVSNSKQPGFEGFFEQVQEINTVIEGMTKLLKDLQEANERSKTVTRADDMKEIKKSMERNVNEVIKLGRQAKAKLEKLDKDNEENRTKPEFGPGSGVERSRATTTISLKRKLKERISEFQTLRQKIQDEYKEVIERRVYTVTGQRADEETINRLMETGDSEQIFSKAIQEQGKGRILDTVQEIQERHDAMKEIEQKLLELQQIFLDMSVLVESQGEILNSISEYVENAAEHITSGTTVLQGARRLQKNTRKWTFIGILIVIIIIAIIVLAILKPWQTSNGSKS